MLKNYTKIIAVAFLAASAASTCAFAQHVVGTITLPNLPEGLAADPFTNQIFVAVPNFGAEPYDFLTVIDGRSDKVIKNIKIPPVAYAVAVDPFDCLAFVGGINLETEKSEVVVVDEKTGRVLGQVQISSTPGDGILGLAYDARNNDLYVSNGSDNEMDVVHDLKVKERIALSAEPFGVVVNPFVDRLYVALQSGSVTTIDTKTHAATTTAVGTADAGITVDVLSGNVFTANAVYTDAVPNMGVGVLNRAGTTVLATVSAGNTPIGIDVDSFTHNVYVANTQDGTVSVIDGKTFTNVDTLPVSGLFLTVNPFTRKVYVGADNSSPTVTVITEH